jgi:hypothetical protein
MCSRLIVVLMSVVLICASAGRAGEQGKLAPLKFLLGEWEPVKSGKAGEASGGSATFTASLQGRIIIRNSFAEYPGRDGRGAVRHDDLMVIYVDTDSLLKADYYDNEGHVIRYTVQTPNDSIALFISAATPKLPGYRLTYVLTADGYVHGKFEFAPPGKPEAFAPYMSWVTRKVDTNKAMPR